MTTDRNSPEHVNRRRGYQSLFFKLFSVLVGAVLITYLAFGGFYRSFWNFSSRSESNKNTIHYSDLLSREIGSPPDTILAARLAKELGRAIGISGKGLNWRSPNFSKNIWNHFQPLLRDTVNSSSGHLRKRDPENDLQSAAPDSINIMLREGRIWTAVDNADYVYIYGSRRRPFVEGLTQDWITLFLVLSMACALAWFILHRLLKPLTVLEAGVIEVRAGNLDVKLPEEGRDELAELARSFNSMTQSLKERILARDQLLLDVSHELRSPLTRMRVALEIAAPGTAVESLKEEVEDLEKMVTELLETERLQSGQGGLKLEPVDLLQLVKKKATHFEGQSPGLVTNFKEVPITQVDPIRLRLILRNILENAFKYGRNALKPIEFSMRMEGSMVLFEVRDYGPGIPEKDLKLVFEPFYRVDRARSRASGYGLGLGLCKRVVELHGGSISLASRLGEGTRVTIKLPLSS